MINKNINPSSESTLFDSTNTSIDSLNKNLIN